MTMAPHLVPGNLLARLSAAAVCVLVCLPLECRARTHPGSAALKHRIDLVQKLAGYSNRQAYAESVNPKKERPSYSLQHLPLRTTRRDRKNVRARKQEARDRYGQAKYKGMRMGKLVSKIGEEDVEFYKKGIQKGHDEEWWKNDHADSGIECCGVNCCGRACCASRKPPVAADPKVEAGAVDVGHQGSVIHMSRSGTFSHEGAEQLLP